LTCGVCPHHLFLTEDVQDSAYARMKPPPSKKDVEFLWNNIKHVDVIESDHAPHTKKKKTLINRHLEFRT
jgi:dihydroorotase-like cyclic amidohydrolase